jgi:hypothetical protein
MDIALISEWRSEDEARTTSDRVTVDLETVTDALRIIPGRLELQYDSTRIWLTRLSLEGAELGCETIIPDHKDFDAALAHLRVAFAGRLHEPSGTDVVVIRPMHPETHITGMIGRRVANDESLS